ncbi:FadR/GntR family transcriptional regulator [Streptomyces tubercidicus]|uniref:FadR/GntR family transcriptional regulator n=1 Tax=Streptomyces tubercidicus TaxID=47759 RepID=UPI0034676714
MAYAIRGVHGQAVDTLARRILSGELGEGSTLDMPALQAELDISLTVLREALKVLAAKGMIDARPKRGTFVRPRSSWNLLDADLLRWQLSGRQVDQGLLADLTEVRSIIEPASARLAAARGNDQDLAAIDAALSAMATASGDPAAEIQADLAFHRALFSATHNELLQRMEIVLEAGLAERDQLVHSGHPHTDPEPSHRAVADAIRARDADAAEQAMRDLIVEAERDLDAVRRHDSEGDI